jgi:hypothetical protein
VKQVVLCENSDSQKIAYLYSIIFKNEIMKKSATLILSLSLFAGLFLMNRSAAGQETSKAFPGLPDNINKIVSVSCVPCHTNTGGFMAKGKLNLNVWAEYSPEKQKDKAANMYAKVKKGSMPPKSAREARPEIVLSNEQIEVIKVWSESITPTAK